MTQDKKELSPPVRANASNTSMVKLRLPGYKLLKDFAKEFKSDFDCLRPETRPQQFSTISSGFDVLNQGNSTRTSVESSLALTTIISNPVNGVRVDSPQPMSSPASVTAGSSTSSITGTFISQASDDTVDSCAGAAEEATLAGSCSSRPETEDDTGSDTSGTEEDSKSQETADAEGTVSDDDCPQHMARTYQFHNCQYVYLNAFNAHGVKVENSGNNTPQVTYESFPSSSSSSASSCHSELCQSSRYEVVPSDFIQYESPPMLPLLSFQESMDSSSHPPGIPPASVGIPGRDSDRFTVIPPARTASMSPRNSSLMQGDDANWSRHSPKMPESKNFKLPKPDSKFPSHTTNISSHPNHMGFFLPPSAGTAVQNNRTSSPDSDSILEEHLELVLDVVQKRLQSRTFSPRAQGSLKLISDLVSLEAPVTSSRTTSTSESLYSCDSAHSRPYSGYC